MASDHRARLAGIRRFDQLIAYLRDEMGWPIGSDDFEELTFEYTPEELGIDPGNAAKIQEIKRLRPLVPNQPWGIFFIKFEPKRLPVVALRRILGQVALKKRASANKSERQAWAADDLLFVSNYGEGEERRITFAHFSKPQDGHDLPTLKVLGWDNLDTPLHLDAVARELTEHLAWPDDEDDPEAWRERWRAAFTLRHREVITTSKQLSERLAELAGAIRDLITTALAIESQDGPLTRLMRNFQQALVHDLDAAGFADMYAQTITYGLLSARIADPERKTAEDFAAHMRTSPFLRELMEAFLHVGGRRGNASEGGIDFDELGVSEVVELLNGANMEAVVRDFGDRNPQEDPVIHFYEHFLTGYDKKQKVSRGVFYTPRPVVSYIVRSVDELLRTAFGLEDGLADTTTWGEMLERHEGLEIPEGTPPDQPFVQILDPATGTGTFLVEVIDLIHSTMVDKWEAAGYGDGKIRALWNAYVARDLLPRLHGYELLMAPYAIAHLKIGLKLYETGYRFASEERARIYLTNALEPAHDLSGRLEFAVPALAHEAEAVNVVKRYHRFTVVIGNPPYAGLSSNMGPWIDGLLRGRLPDSSPTASYYHVDGEPLGERKLWLQDDYVKFIRLSQWLLDASGYGIHGYITNHGYLDNPTFRGMRRSLMASFPALYLVDLHGNALKRERAPDGSDDQNVFEIRQGVAICLGVRGARTGTLLRTDAWGSAEEKYAFLAENSVASTTWTRVRPEPPFFFFQTAAPGSGAYHEWPQIPELMPIYSSGVITARDALVLDYEPEPILRRMADLRDTQLSDAEVRARLFAGKGSRKYAAGDSRSWKLTEARSRLREDDRWRERIAYCLYRPFDRRCVYLTEWMVDWSRPELRRHLAIGRNPLLVFPRNTGAGRPWTHVFVAYEPILGRFFPDSACITYMAPAVALREETLGPPGMVAVNAVTQEEGVEEDEDVRRCAARRLSYMYGILHCPTYRTQYASQLRADFPRVPDTGDPELKEAIIGLGRALVALHLMESPRLETLITEYTGARNPEIGRVGWCDGTVWLDAGKTTAREGHRATTPGTVGFKGVAEKVWDFHIGGYQVCHNWLRDRKGRILSEEDIAHYQKIVVALNETIRIMAEIDGVVEAHGGWPGAFQMDRSAATRSGSGGGA